MNCKYHVVTVSDPPNDYGHASGVMCCNNAFIKKIVEIAAAHSCNISAVNTQSSKVYMWGQCRGQSVNVPQRTRFKCVDDVFACFASPPVSFRQLTFTPVTQHSIQDSVKSAFDDPCTSDVIFLVDNRAIYVHKAILKIRCQHFRSMFKEGTWNEDQKE